jgi:hypothetical protein
MARSAAITVENNFSKGLITEATGLNFPENAVTETFDCIFDQTGLVYRRAGLEFESEFAVSVVSYTDAAIAEYVWVSVDKDGDKTFLAVQIGTTISLYEMEDDQVISDNETFSYSLLTFAVPGAENIARTPVSFAAGEGLLFITHPGCEPVFIERDDDGNFTVTEVEIRIRDVEGLDNVDSGGEYFDVDYRPTIEEATTNVKYNVLNQGWTTEVEVLYGGYGLSFFDGDTGFLHFPVTTVPAIDAFVFPYAGHSEHSGKYPSEADVWWTFKRIKESLSPSGARIQHGGGPDGFELTMINSTFKFGNTAAPKGHYVYNAFHIDRSAESGIEGIPVVTAGSSRPSRAAFYAGRAFYAGVNVAGFNTKIYFSRIIQNTRYAGDCFQTADPTREEGGDIVASDGGYISIPEMARVVKMLQMGGDLIIVATNGTWRISGSEGTGFTATDFSVNKISNIGGVSESSFVIVEGAPIWWNSDGIWTIQNAGGGGASGVVSLTDKTIRDYFQTIPVQNIPYVKGAYNPREKIVQWLFRSDLPEEHKENFQYDRILNLDITTSAFYPWTIPSDVRFKIIGIISIAGPAVVTTEVDVTDSDDVIVTDSSDETVTADLNTVVETASKFKYLTSDFLTDAPRVIAVGNNFPTLDADDQTMVTSFDGASWIVGNGFTDHAPHSIAYGNDVYVMTGMHEPNGGNTARFIARSTDYGTTWTATFYGDDFEGAEGNIVRFADGIFMVGGYSSDPERAWLATSDDDGVTWTEQDMSFLSPVTSSMVTDLAHDGDSRWVAQCNIDSISVPAYSDDNGETWTIAGTPPTFADGTRYSAPRLAYGNDIWVCVDDEPLSPHQTASIWTSPDGDVWTQRDVTALVPNILFNSQMVSVAFGDGYFIAGMANTSQNSILIRSTDGINWTADLTFGAMGSVLPYGLNYIEDLDLFISTAFARLQTSSDAATFATPTIDLSLAARQILDAAGGDVTTTLRFSEFTDDTNYKDWFSEDGGTDYTSYFITGYKLRGQGIKRFQSNYIELYVPNDDDSIFDFRSRMDYATSGDTGRWSSTQRITTTSGDYAYTRRRLLLRGTGLASQFEVTSISGEPFAVIGWVTSDSANQNI